MDLAVDGVPVGVIPAQVLANLATGSLEVYVSSYSIQRVLCRIGVTARLEGTVWDLAELSTQVPLAPAMKPDAILDSTLVSWSDDRRLRRHQRRFTVPAVIRSPVAAPRWSAPARHRQGPAARRQRSEVDRTHLRFTFQVRSTLPAGHYPVTVTWALPGHPRSAPITHDPGSHEILVGGYDRRSYSRHHDVVAFTGTGVRVSRPDAFGIGNTNSGHASAIADDPATGLIAVVGDAHLHFFTPAGDPVPPHTSRSDGATPLAGLGHGGTVAAIAS